MARPQTQGTSLEETAAMFAGQAVVGDIANKGEQALDRSMSWTSIVKSRAHLLVWSGAHLG
jgi:hypothetical protein